MALRFRLKGLAETFIDEIQCPNCGIIGDDDESFDTQYTRVTLQGIVAIVQCKCCQEIFVPKTQRLGIVNIKELKEAVEEDSQETGEPVLTSFQDVIFIAEKLNSIRKGSIQ